MNKKELLEIKKQFTPDNCAITKICTCYVNGDKDKVTTSEDAFLSLPEEEEFKYFDILRSTLSGSITKNLENIRFSIEEEKENGKQEMLLKLRDSQLRDRDLLDRFYDKIIASYDTVENYLIVLIHGVYDIPGKAGDGTEMFDASDEVYSYIMCSICPVKLAKPGLAYIEKKNEIHERIRDRVVDKPMNGFLFPAFNDRGTDIHEALYYAKKPEDGQDAFIEEMFGTEAPVSPEMQKAAFEEMLGDVLLDATNYETVKNINESLMEIMDENRDNPEPVRLGKEEIKKVLESSGVAEDQMEHFDAAFDAHIGKTKDVVASNVVNTRKFCIETPDILLKVNPERADLVSTKTIDGRKCIVIAVDDNIDVNGVNVTV